MGKILRLIATGVGILLLLSYLYLIFKIVEDYRREEEVWKEIRWMQEVV